mmetsp:Transcript_15932/g.46064  ORF Transcript_15932/g.46064 Transcript_15932/m.46064 type:complete len:217 (+) Transcript_15932:2033-2683(+)
MEDAPLDVLLLAIDGVADFFPFRVDLSISAVPERRDRNISAAKPFMYCADPRSEGKARPPPPPPPPPPPLSWWAADRACIRSSKAASPRAAVLSTEATESSWDTSRTMTTQYFQSTAGCRCNRMSSSQGTSSPALVALSATANPELGGVLAAIADNFATTLLATTSSAAAAAAADGRPAACATSASADSLSPVSPSGCPQQRVPRHSSCEYPKRDK